MCKICECEQEYGDDFTSLEHLQSLNCLNCPHLTSIPQSLVNLQRLDCINCPLLTSIPPSLVKLANLVFEYVNPWRTIQSQRLKYECDTTGVFLWEKWCQGHEDLRIHSLISPPSVSHWNGRHYGSFLMYRTTILETPYNQNWSLAAINAFYERMVREFDCILDLVSKWFEIWSTSKRNLHYQAHRDPRALCDTLTPYHITR